MRKFINPFKPHIVEFANGKFAVRKFNFTGWYYYDNQALKKDDYWWSGTKETQRPYYEVDTLELAKLLLEMCQLREQVSSKKVVKVHQ